MFHHLNIVVVQLLSHVWLFGTTWTAAHQAPLSFTVFLSLVKLMSTESVMPSYHLTLYHPVLLLPSFFPSIRVFSDEWALYIRRPNYWSFTSSKNQSWLPLGLTGLISLLSKRLSRAFLSTAVRKHQLFGAHSWPIFTDIYPSISPRLFEATLIIPGYYSRR